MAALQHLRWARFLQLPGHEGVEEDVELRGPKVARQPFDIDLQDYMWQRGSGSHDSHGSGAHGHGDHEHGAHHEHHEHLERGQSLSHLEHHTNHDDSMSDVGLALISSGTTIFLAMISAIFAMRLFREMLRPQTPAGNPTGDMQGVLQLDIPGVQPFRPFSGQGHRLVMEPEKDERPSTDAAPSQP
eukprot:symbB.v1.2.015443.t1/scaffold1114.1/size137040/1